MFLLSFYRSTIGKKIIMGVTGLIGIGFVILHMAGNLQVFIGQEKINSYGARTCSPRRCTPVCRGPAARSAR